MKTIEIRKDGIRLIPQKTLSTAKNILSIFTIMCCLQLNGQIKPQEISVSTSPTTMLLVERWASEYNQVNHNIKIVVLNAAEGNQSKIKVISFPPENVVNDQVIVEKVARQIYLPVMNENNPFFSKELKKGLKQNQLKTIFFRQEIHEWEPTKQNEPLYKVYTKMPQSSAAQSISAFFGMSTFDLKGVFVSGDDSHLISALLKDSTAISFGNLALIFNQENGLPVSGITILPVDLNGNGKVDKVEYNITTLNEILNILESSKSISIPYNEVAFIVDSKQADPDVVNFLSWVKQQGQEFNSKYGFLRTADLKPGELTQKIAL